MTEIREALHAIADTAARQASRPPVTDLRHRVNRRRVRMASTTAALTVLAVAAGAIAVDRHDRGVPVPAITPTASPTASPSPSVSATASPAAVAPPAPSTIVATRQEAWELGLELLSALTGRVGRRVDINSGEGSVAPVVSYDRKTVYFSRVETSCRNEIVTVPVHGGAERHIAYGGAIALSRDGRRLAYLTRADCDQPDVLVVHDLVTGAERTWSSAGFSGLLTPAWAPDSRHLAILGEHALPPGPAEPGSGGVAGRDLYILDADGPGTAVADGRKARGTPTDHYLAEAPIYRGGDGTLVLLEGCCHLNFPSRLVQIDPETGSRKVLVTFDGDVSWVDFDASGAHMLHVSSDATLYRWDDGHPVAVAHDIWAADW
jgi:Tol biopolymer transport system component